MSADVIKAPGKAEVAAIKSDYQEAMGGAVAWIRMGVRLLDAKGRLPHGKFMKWCDANFQRAGNLKIGKSHLCNSMLVARAFIEKIVIDSGRDYTFEELLFMVDDKNGLFAQMIEGKSTRCLLIEAREMRNDVKETEARLKCEEAWAKSPAKRDEWEPLVLGGEKTYIQAWMGMMGQETTKGKTRAPIQMELCLEQNVAGIKRHWKGWEKMKKARRAKFMESFFEAVESAPDEVKESLRKHLTE